MFVKPRAPPGNDPIARLQDRPQARSRPAPHQAEMATVLARHQFGDRARLTVAPHAQHDALVGPFHGRSTASCAPIPKFALYRRTSVCELRNRKCNLLISSTWIA